MSEPISNRARRRLEQRKEIRQICEEQFCFTWVPEETKEAVWSKAWEDGHAGGVQEIEQHYQELMEIVATTRPVE